jgi:hypothetical protein
MQSLYPLLSIVTSIVPASPNRVQYLNFPTTPRRSMNSHQSGSLHQFQNSRSRSGGNTKAAHQFVGESNPCGSFEPRLIRQSQRHHQRNAARKFQHTIQPRQRNWATDKRPELSGYPFASTFPRPTRFRTNNGNGSRLKSERFESVPIVHNITSLIIE